MRRKTTNMKSFLNFLAVCSLFYFAASITFEDVTAKDKDGGIQINFTLNATIENAVYIFIVECDIDSVMNSGDAMTNANTNMQNSTGCNDYPSTDLTKCCDDCINSADNQTGSVSVSGPIFAGEEYSCTIFGNIGGIDVDMNEIESFEVLIGMYHYTIMILIILVI